MRSKTPTSPVCHKCCRECGYVRCRCASRSTLDASGTIKALIEKYQKRVEFYESAVRLLKTEIPGEEKE